MLLKPLNELNLAGTVWLAADIHLGALIPLTALAFYDFLKHAQTNTDNLILCGDIFDSWIGDDDALKKPAPWLHQAILELKDTANKINLFIMPGNRDFLISNKLAKHIGANLIPSPSKIILQNYSFLLAHGDEYCTDDISYQRFRAIVHNRFIQFLFLSLPLSTRRNIAKFARNKSKSARHKKPNNVMDVNQLAIKSALKQANTSIIIHGHTHRPAIHKLEIEQTTATRYVLPDWEMDHDKRGGWLSIESNKIELNYLNNA